MASNTSDRGAMAWTGEQCCPSTSFPPPTATAGCSHLFPRVLSGLSKSLTDCWGKKWASSSCIFLRFPRSEHGRLFFMSIWCQMESRVSGKNAPSVNTKRWPKLWWDRGAASGIFPNTRRRASVSAAAQGVCPRSRPDGRERLCVSRLRI